MHLPSVLLLLCGLAVFAAGERQRFCYMRVGNTRKYAVTEYVQGTVADESCEGAHCVKTAGELTPVTVYKTEVVFRTERHCCAGYQRSPDTPDSCVPVCRGGCPQGEHCTAPNRCECAEGRERNSEGRCVAVAASLPGGEPVTLRSQILSYVSLLLDVVKPPMWGSADHSRHAPTAVHEETPTARAASEEYSEGSGAIFQEAAQGEASRRFALLNSAAGPCRSNGTGLQDLVQSPWLEPGSLEQRWNRRRCLPDARPLVLPLALGGQRFVTAESR